MQLVNDVIQLQREFLYGVVHVVLESPVMSGFFPPDALTGTLTG